MRPLPHTAQDIPDVCSRTSGKIKYLTQTAATTPLFLNTFFFPFELRFIYPRLDANLQCVQEQPEISGLPAPLLKYLDTDIHTK